MFKIMSISKSKFNEDCYEMCSSVHYGEDHIKGYAMVELSVCKAKAPFLTVYERVENNGILDYERVQTIADKPLYELMELMQKIVENLELDRVYVRKDIED